MLCVLPLFSGRLNLPPLNQSFSFPFSSPPFFFFVNTNDIQFNDTSIADCSRGPSCRVGHGVLGAEVLNALNRRRVWGWGYRTRTNSTPPVGVWGLDNLSGSV